MVKWRGRRQSDNIEDRRGMSRGVGGGAALNGLVIPLLRLVLSKFGITGIVFLGLGYFALQAIGIDPLALLSGQPQTASERPLSEADQQAGNFSAVILAETEDVWTRRFASEGKRYQPPGMVLYSGYVSSACGSASSAMGPFYCPADQKVYLDTSFFDELSRRFGAPGDFAGAYVIAHEVGHHIQTITGISKQVRQAQARASKVEKNALQVRMELQADCYAGIWAHDADRTAGILEPGDIEEGLGAAEAIGDDALRRNAGQPIQPETFTHGSSEQRQRWFTTGYKTGNVEACDTFAATRL